MKDGEPMKIYKVVADKKPKNCIECPLFGKRECGEDRMIQASSSSAFHVILPDHRCVIRESGVQH
jgi:hypothetical protein